MALGIFGETYGEPNLKSPPRVDLLAGPMLSGRRSTELVDRSLELRSGVADSYRVMYCVDLTVGPEDLLHLGSGYYAFPD